MFDAVYKFKISDEGEWKADFKFEFNQIDNNFDDRLPPPEGRKGPFYAQEYSRIQSNTAVRARKLAKPSWDLISGRSDEEFGKLILEEEHLNKTINFSFQYHYINKGKW
jgi:hypothetical protein